jgi:hypothetical protein
VSFVSLGCGGGKGRVPSLASAAVEKEAAESYLISFVFDVPSMGYSA